MNELLRLLWRLKKLEYSQAQALDASTPRLQLVETLVARGLFTEAQLLEIMSGHLGVEVAHLESVPQLRAAQAADFSALKRIGAVLLGERGERLLVGTDNPLDGRRRADLELLFARPIDLVPVPGAELAAFFDPPRRDPGRTVTADEWKDLLCEALGVPVSVAEREGSLELSAPGATLRVAEDRVQAGPVQLALGAGQPWDVARRMAGRLVEIARRFQRREGNAPAPEEVARAVARLRDEADSAREGHSVHQHGDRLIVTHHFVGWVTSHETGPMSREVGWVDVAGIPSGWVALLLRHVLDVAAWSTIGPPAVCRFCERELEAIDFDRHLGTCHRCAERYLGVVH